MQPWAAALVLAWVFPHPLLAQCIVDNPGGSKVNINRPVDGDVPPPAHAPLSYLNRTLPEWLCFTAGYRTRLEGYTGAGFQPNSSDSYLLTRFRLGVSISPTAWLKVYAEAQDATAFWKTLPRTAPYQTTWDLRRAYADLGDVAGGRLSLRVGRQDLNFGYGRLVGTSYWRNASRGYDAVLLTVNREWLHLSVFTASPVVPFANGLSHHQQGHNLHGVYATWKKLIPGAVLEPYLFWRLTPGVRTETGAGLAKLDEKTIGIRWAGTASWMEYDVEGARQIGWAGTDQVRSGAWMLDVAHTFDPQGRKLRLFAEYDFASGDRRSGDGRRGTFDQLFPNIHDHHGLADQVAWQNLKEIRFGARISLKRNWTLAAAYNDWWLANPADGFYDSSGSILSRDPTGRSGTHIGRELDVQNSFRLNRHVEIAGGFAHVQPGSFLILTGRPATHRYPYIMLYYNVF